MFQSNIKKSQLSFKELLALYWRVFVSSPLLFILIPLVVYIPRLLIQLQFPEEDLILGRTVFNSPITRFWYLYNFLIGTLSTIAVSYLTKDTIDNKRSNLSVLLKESLVSWWKVMKTKLLAYTYIFALSLIVVIPGAVHAFYWMFITPIVLFRGKEGRAAMKYSKKLVVSGAGTIFFQLVGLFFITFLIFILLAFVILLTTFSLVNSISFSPIFAYFDLLVSIFTALTVIPLTILFVNRDELHKTG